MKPETVMIMIILIAEGGGRGKEGDTVIDNRLIDCLVV